MFKWADGGTLAEFWKTHKTPTLTTLLVADSFKQILGLVDGLQVLHSHDIRHGDVKPDNILLDYILDQKSAGDRSYIDVGHWKHADLGLAKEHDTRTSERLQPTSMRYTTYKYESPEANARKPRARIYDIWSIGCVILEHIVWLLYGYEVLKDFNIAIADDNDRRMPQFYSRTPGNSFIVHPMVEAAMNYLERDPELKADLALKQLLKLVRTKMLVVNLERIPGKDCRTGAKVIVGELTEIIGKGNSYPQYWCSNGNRENLRPMKLVRSQHLSTGSRAGNEQPVRTRSVENFFFPVPAIDIQEFTGAIDESVQLDGSNLQDVCYS